MKLFVFCGMMLAANSAGMWLDLMPDWWYKGYLSLPPEVVRISGSLISGFAALAVVVIVLITLRKEAK